MSERSSRIFAVLSACIALTSASDPSIARSRSRPGERAIPQAILSIQRIKTAVESSAGDTHAKYEPEAGCLLGGYIEFDSSLKRKIYDYDRVQRRDPAQFEQRVGRRHAMYFFYVGYGRPAPLGWIRWLADHGKSVHIALEPNDGLDKVRDDAYLRGLADSFAATRARIFLRFGSEMNGEWTNYHNPKRFREKFRLVYSTMHRRAPNVALVWCPYATPVRVIPNYYPGDDATDWVGVNMYSVIYHDNRLSAPSEHEHTSDLLATVYNGYAARKPMMICEFGATHYSACDGRRRPDFAALKIGTLYSALPRLFPRVKAINYFDFSSSGVNNNYSVTDDPRVLEAYRRSTASDYFLSDGAGVNGATRKRVPMPLQKNDLLRGRVELSCFARGPSDHVYVKYRLDGAVIYQASHPIDWPCTWDAWRVKPGRHKLSLEVYNMKGLMVASQSVSVVTAL